MADLCLSGGADGADLAWGDAARRHGHRVVHFSFAGHRTRARPDERRVLSAAELAAADPFLARANATLRRRWPPARPYALNLLRRDWYQVRDAGSVYAVAERDRRGRIAGGTAWAVQMFLDRHEGAACAAYLFDPREARWFAWQGEWTPLAAPPQPQGAWAGIGTRRLPPSGAAAIARLFDLG
jgi:hypothetical protein